MLVFRGVTILSQGKSQISKPPGPKPPILPLVEPTTKLDSRIIPPQKRHQKTAANEVKNQLCVMNKAQKQAEERNVAKGALLQVGPERAGAFFFFCGKAWIFGAIFFFGGFILNYGFI